MSRVRLAMLAMALLLLGGCATAARVRPGDRAWIAGKTFVVTGASSGFGKGVALKLAGLHANVVLAARRTAALEAVADRARALGGGALVVTTDVSRPDQVERLANAATERFGRIDVWINDAGLGAIGPFTALPIEDQARVVDINLTGVIYGSYAALRRFQAQGYGTLVNIGSNDSEVPLAYQATYSATKAGVLALGRALNEELRLAGQSRIKVATVLPWAADTPFWQHAANYSGHSVRMPAMDDAGKVVNAIVWVSVHPKEELAVGWKAKASYFSHTVLPDLTERVAADIAHRSQMEDAPPAPPTHGSLYQPVQAGTGVEGGARKRMEEEDNALKQAHHR